MTLREYAPGDDLRHVHWRSTARRGHLMMRQNETRRRAPVLLMLDVRPATHDRASFERAVEAVASIATALDRAGRPFEVAWSTGTTVGAPGPPPPRVHHGRARDRRTARRRSPAHRVDPPPVERAHRGHGPAARERRGEPRPARPRRRAPRHASRPPTRSAPVAPRARRFRSLVVAHDERPFAHSWNEAVLRWQRTGNLPTSPSPARS